MNKIHWYLNRLSLMSPSEVLFRGREELYKKYERITFKDFKVAAPLEPKKIVWFFEPSDQPSIAQTLAQDFKWTSDKADQYLQHRFSFFSLHDKNFGPDIDWHCDYKNNITAPLKYCKDIDYRDFNEVGDFKYIWEVNRHQHLISLAKAYFLTRREEYKKEVRQQIMGWIKANPYLMGTNWQSAMELAVRLIAWSWVWHYIGELDDEWKQAWLDSIYKHCSVINRSFSRFSSANNHLIGEAAGLYVASIVWPFAGASEQWQAESFKILNEEILKQTHPDGVNKEQAISYQQFVLDFFLLCGMLGEKNGQKFPTAYWDSIKNMIEFLASITNRSGQLPLFGDSDDGFAVILSDVEPFNPYRSLISTGAALFNRGDWKSKVPEFDEKSFWLLGKDGKNKFDQLKPQPFHPKKKFEHGGHYLLSDQEGTANEVLAVVDCAPLGYLSIAAHGHADALSFNLSYGGVALLVDPGTYVYQNPKEWRNYFKGTSAHNTIRVDGHDQSMIGGHFMWLLKANAQVLSYETNEHMDRIVGQHDGYRRLKDPVTHVREIVFDKKEKLLKIVDKIEAKGEHLIEQFFHCADGAQVDPLTPHQWWIQKDGRQIKMVMDHRFDSKVFCEEENPILGWTSDRFDCKKPAPSIKNVYTCRGSAQFETMIYLESIA